MGLDILFNGGRAVRLFIQGCLVLWLGLFSSHLFADGLAYFRQSDFYQIDNPTQPYDCSGKGELCVTGSYTVNLKIYFYETWCSSGFQHMELTGTNSAGRPSYTCYLEPPPPPQCVALSHEPDPITGEVGATNTVDCSCADGYVSSGLAPGEAEYDCQIPPQQPDQCYENGQIYDADHGYCVLDCPNGQLDGVCLQDTADNSDACDASSPDYKGSIGFGDKKQNICESDTTCEGGSLGVVNDIQVCVPDEYGPPTCSKDDVLVMDEFGWACAAPNDPPPDDPQPDPQPNTDTDGDGTPDEYQRSNDPDAVNKGLDNVADGVGESNKQLKNANKQLDNIGKGLSQVNKNLDVGLGAVNKSLDQIQEGMKPPEGGFNPDGFGGLIPTFEESFNNLSESVRSLPPVAIAEGMAQLPENQVCPIYTIPATPFTDPIAMDIHCKVLGEYRGVISALMLFFWAGSALFLFLRA